MRAPTIRYVTTSDGVSIAYAVSGRGRPLVLAPSPLHHIQVGWEWPPHRAWLESLAERFRLIQFDGRGQGMSQRGLPATFRMSDYQLDLAAVIDAVESDRFILAGIGWFGHVAARYSEEHPERVEALVLWSTGVSGDAFPHIRGVGRDNFDLLLWSNVSPALSHADATLRFQQLKQMVTQDDLVRAAEACATSDLSDVLPRIAVPTFVLHPRGWVHLSADEAVRIAAAIPAAQLMLLENRQSPQGMHGDPEAVVEAFDGILASLPARPERSGVPLSARQLEVLQLIAQGMTTHEVADTLVLSEPTVERHISDIYTKLGVRNRAEATAYAVRHFPG